MAKKDKDESTKRWLVINDEYYSHADEHCRLCFSKEEIEERLEELLEDYRSAERILEENVRVCEVVITKEHKVKIERSIKVIF